MTTKPTARRYRTRRATAFLREADAETAAANDVGADDGFGGRPFPTTGAPPGGPDDPAGRTEPDDLLQARAAISAEGLTKRQLHTASRLAHRHGLHPADGEDAVRLLREAGIDPLQRSNILGLVTSDLLPDATPTTPAKPIRMPSTEERAEDARSVEILRIQRDIARRRRSRMAALCARLLMFVALPTLICGLYFYRIATPMYSTTSEFVIQQADGQGTGALGGLFSGTGLATSQDSITVQGYLQSREAMLRLDADVGFKTHFSQPEIDSLQRIEAGSSAEEAYALYRKLVKISYDPTEGIIKMNVVAADPRTSEAFSRALIDYAEQQVDALTQRLRADQMQGARESFAEAETKMTAAQSRVLELQEQLGVLDPVSESAALMGQISSFEVQLEEKKLQLSQLLDNARPNRARVDGVSGDISRLEEVVARLRGQLTAGDRGSSSLAQVTGQLRTAEVDFETRQLMMQQALQQLETARIEANRQVRYLSLGVSPVAPDEPTFPRSFENTVVSMLIFSGLYLMASLTASILREQVSS